MKKTGKKYNRIAYIVLSLSLLTGLPMQTYATTASDIQGEIDSINQELNEIEQKKKDAQKEQSDAKSGLSGVNGQINSISGAMGDLGEEIEGINDELVALLTDIDLITSDIESKKEQIAQTQIEYDEALETQINQYESMKIRIKYMYEQGDATYLSILLDATSSSLGDALNKADYVEQLYTYDRMMLEKYIATVNYTKEVWDTLEEEKSELETSKIELQEEEAYLEELEAQLQGEYDNYGVMLAKAKQQAAVYTAKINQQTNEIKALEKEAKAKQEEADKKKQEKLEAEQREAEEAAKAAREAAGMTDDNDDDDDDDDDDARSSSSTSSSSSSSSSGGSYSASGSGTGSQIASYGLQFVGNPYVAGGTSLTNGADCSGFVQSVYKAFGYNLPRTSYSQANVGRSVSYSEAQPGDIIYYGGHVGIYIGNGQIVHASTERTGIKVTAATYRSIVTVRRVVN